MSVGSTSQSFWAAGVRSIVRFLVFHRTEHMMIGLDLTALTPWLEALATPDELTAIAQSIVDVSRCWP
jgi:hypothetical protein